MDVNIKELKSMLSNLQDLVYTHDKANKSQKKIISEEILDYQNLMIRKFDLKQLNNHINHKMHNYAHFIHDVKMIIHKLENSNQEPIN